MRRRRRQPEEHVNHERWLVSYADFITLLFAFFVVMYSISQVNESKYRVLSDTLTAAFKRPEISLDPFQVGIEARSNPMNVIELDGKSGQPEPGGEGLRQGSQPDAFIDISERITASLGDLIQQQLVRISGTEAWLEIELSSSLLFASGAADLSNQALVILGKVAEALAAHDNAIQVEGFTDNVPIATHQFPSNWELSTARAAAVVRLFVEEGIVPERLSAVGYGEHRPTASNSAAEGRARNRRVVVKVSRLPPPVHAEAAVQKPLPAAEPFVNDQPGTQPDGPVDIARSGVDDSDTGVPTPQIGQDSAAGVRTIELESGDLLFTRDTGE